MCRVAREQFSENREPLLVRQCLQECRQPVAVSARDPAGSPADGLRVFSTSGPPG